MSCLYLYCLRLYIYMFCTIRSLIVLFCFSKCFSKHTLFVNNNLQVIHSLIQFYLGVFFDEHSGRHSTHSTVADSGSSQGKLSQFKNKH